MGVNEVVNDLWWQIHPDVEYSVLILVPESILQILFNVRYDDMGPTEIHGVP